MAWHDGLTGEALRIGSSDEIRIRVMAGPGSGKTYSLMRRIARLLETGIEPTRILLLTFTRTAANDLVKALNGLNVPGADQITAGTLHSYCFSVLSQERVLQLTNRTPRPLLNFEVDFVIEDLRALRGEGKKEIDKKLSAFEAGWARLQHEEPGFTVRDDDRQFHNDIIDYLRFSKGMLVGEIIPITLEYFRNNPQCPELSSYDHVFVDEYQDLNKAEQNLIDRLSQNASLMVIGDEDQSIYQGFRHANPEGVRLFHQTHPNTADFSLETCRRCPKRIVSIADSFIQLNQNREPRHLNPNEDNVDGAIYSVQWQTIEDEANGIGKLVKHKISQGINPGEILILCPRRQFGYAVKEALIEEGIEAHSYFQEEMLDEEDARVAYSILNLLVNPKDNTSLRCAIGKGENPNSAGFNRIKKYCEETNSEMRTVLELLSAGKIKIPYTTRIIENFNEIVATLDSLKNLDPNSLRDTLFPSYAQWSVPFRELLLNLNGDETPSDILSIVRTNIIQPEMPSEVDFVRIMSLHKSKGLSAQIVVISGFIESLIPRRDDDLTQEELLQSIEEQRRLVYVGLTRSRAELIISSVYNIPKGIAFAMGANVIGTTGRARTISSSFIPEFGPNFPETITGEEFLESLKLD